MFKKAKDRKFYIDLFKSEECICGREKRARTAFCYLCFRELPPHLKTALYRSFGDGFEEAVDESCEYLHK